VVSVCGYILAINLQNFTEIYLAYVKILQIVLGGYFFLLTLYCVIVVFIYIIFILYLIYLLALN